MSLGYHEIETQHPYLGVRDLRLVSFKSCGTMLATRSFASANLHSGALFSHVFDQPGTVAYRCTLHQYMTGSVTVIGTA